MHNSKTQAHDEYASTHKQTQMQKDRNRNSSDRHADTLTYQKTPTDMQTHAGMQTHRQTLRQTGTQACKFADTQACRQRIDRHIDKQTD